MAINHWLNENKLSKVTCHTSRNTSDTYTLYFISSLLNFTNYTLPDEFDFMGYNFVYIFEDIIE